MGLSTSQRKKHAGQAISLLPPGTVVRTYAAGRAHARITNEAIIAGVVFAVVFVVAALLGYILIPGGLLAFFVYHQTRPPRGVVASDQGIAVLARSAWNGRPNKVLALLPPVRMGAASPSGSVTVELGAERITFPNKEFRRLADATASMPAAGMMPYPGAMAPTAPGAYTGAMPPAPLAPPVAPAFGDPHSTTLPPAPNQF